MRRLGTRFGSCAILAGIIGASACGSPSTSSFGGPGDGANGASSGGFASSSGSTTPSCVGLQCQQVACPGGGTTSLSGKVYDPSGTVPLYNAVVYVPNAPLEPFTQGVTCDRCGTTPSGHPIATALTDATGSFRIDDVPVGVDVPLVVQIGRWRRQVMIPAASVNKCADSALGVDSTRLPRSKAEGDIPKIAVTTGGADSLECFLRKLGLDPSEFTAPDGAGSVNLYYGINGSRIPGATATSDALWNDAARLKTYDIVILSCEGDEYPLGDGNGLSVKSKEARANVAAYLDAGGRVFASHYHYTWFRDGAGSLPQTATWSGAVTDGNLDVSVDTSFAKGKALSDWLDTVGATTAPKSATVAMTDVKADVTTVPAAGVSPDVSRRWLYTKVNGYEEVKFYSFNTPIGTKPDAQCGRGVFTDVHVSSGDTPGGTFPKNCTTTGYTAQEKALLFLMMDLASCIQDDSQPPQPPPPVH